MKLLFSVRILALFIISCQMVNAQHSFTPLNQVSNSSDKRLALVIGNSQYSSHPLPNAKNDALDMKNTLLIMGFNVLYYENLSKLAMETALIDFSNQLTNYRVGLFYFSGHGFESNEKINYLMSTDVAAGLNQTLAKSKSLSFDDVMGSMNKSKIETKILLVDACRNNPFRSWQRSGEKGGLGAINAGAGTIVFMAAAPGEESDENPTGRNGLFTQELLKAIKMHNVELNKIIETTSLNVIQKNNFQHPSVFGKILNNFYFITDHKPLVNDSIIKEHLQRGEIAFQQKDFKQAFELLYPYREHLLFKGVNQNQLGCMYDLGKGVNQDYTEAIKWYRKAAELGDVDGQCNLGQMYYYGKGINQDYTEAIKWYRKAAEQGSAFGQVILGYMYENGKGISQDYSEAVKCYRKAAEQGNAIGQNNLGMMYQNGKAISQDYTEAVKWYRKAAEQGNAFGQNNLGTMYKNGTGISQDNTEAVKWHRKAAEQGNALGQNNLGVKYEKGTGVGQDYIEAIKWYRKAAEQGNALGQNNLGYMYSNGKGVGQDYAEAVKWYKKSAEQGNALGQNNLGCMYENGKGGLNKDLSTAIDLYQKSARQGNDYAQKALTRLGKSW